MALEDVAKPELIGNKKPSTKVDYASYSLVANPMLKHGVIEKKRASTLIHSFATPSESVKGEVGEVD